MKKKKGIAPLLREILEETSSLSKEKMKELLDYIYYLRLKEDKAFIDYVNLRTKQVLRDRKQGKKFITLKELQKIYGI